jgi:hypothetical protein
MKSQNICQNPGCGKSIELKGPNANQGKSYCSPRCRVAAWNKRNPRIRESK